jgi:uncharacterized protein YndB with AHSA1/START domain
MATKRFVRRTAVLPVGRVRAWGAISDPAAITRWLGMPFAVEIRPGCVGRAGDRFVQIEEVLPEERISFSWWVVEDDEEPPSRVDLVLEAVEGGTRLTVEETVIDDLDGTEPGFDPDVLEAAAR